MAMMFHQAFGKEIKAPGRKNTTVATNRPAIITRKETGKKPKLRQTKKAIKERKWAKQQSEKHKAIRKKKRQEERKEQEIKRDEERKRKGEEKEKKKK